jgi:hypothetical protein
MYGNSPFGTEEVDAKSLSPDQRRRIERDLSQVAERTRTYLPGEFVVGSELSAGADGPEATVAVRPPVGSVVSAGYSPEDPERSISDDERDDIARGLAASAALQVKQRLGKNDRPTAR